MASEVRKLAERSQKAAGEITELSKSTVETASKAGELISRIVPDIKRTADLVMEISAASKEQNVGADQIGKATMQLDKVIQQNASASEELASMSEELSGQAEQLSQTMSFFKVGTAVQQSVQPHSLVAKKVERRDAGPVKMEEKKAVPAKPERLSEGMVLDVASRPEKTDITLRDVSDDDFQEY